MKKVNMYDAKTHLSEYLADLAEGETLLICKRNKPVAELRTIPKKRNVSRPIGLAKSVFHVPADFFEPLPAEVLRIFDGEQE
jgi:antitoxin (DNA-binding transcriptional repressor) of toxin-antitoxin stability system